MKLSDIPDARLDPVVVELLKALSRGEIRPDFALPLLVHYGVPEPVARACCGAEPMPPPVVPPPVVNVAAAPAPVVNVAAPPPTVVPAPVVNVKSAAPVVTVTPRGPRRARIVFTRSSDGALSGATVTEESD